MNDEKEREVDMSNTDAEMRYVTRNFPNLVLPNRKPVCPIEIDVTALSDNEEYRDAGWEELIRTITATWVKQHAYAGKGTIWAWGSPSVNFGHQSFSMFYAVSGMSTNFRKFLDEKIRVLGASCKTHERRSASPLRLISELEFRSMEPPCSSFNPENGLKVGLPIIHPEFCKRLLGKYVRPNSDYVTPSLEDGWNAICHIEDGKAWEPLDPTLWQEIAVE